MLTLEFTDQENKIENEFKSSSEVDLKYQIAVKDKTHNIKSFFGDLYEMPMQISGIFGYKCKFTTLNGIGRTGPTKIGEYYQHGCHFQDTILDPKQEGMQLWTVPHSGKWRIICCGAKGGDSIDFEEDNHLFGGKGAQVGGIVQLYKNDIIKICCGQMGETSYIGTYGAGGGGGTFFILYKYGNNNPNYKTTNSDSINSDSNIVNKPLIIAAGGHGACNSSKYKVNGIDGLCDSSKDRNDYGGYETNGESARGASFVNDFDEFESYEDEGWDYDYNECNPTSFIDGCIGGKAHKGDKGCIGGFGGGGGSYQSGGAGGGYIGGLPCEQDQKNKDESKYALYGALSFNICKDNQDKVMMSGIHDANGSVEAIYVE